MNTPLFQLLGVLFGAFVVFGVVPRIIFPLSEIKGTALDRTMAGIVLMAAYSCAVMYIFGSIKLLETPAIIASWAVCWYVLKGRRREGRPLISLIERGFAYSDRKEREQMVGRVSSADDRPRSGESKVMRRFHGWYGPIIEDLPTPGELVLRAAVLVTLLISAVLRFARSWDHVELVPQDSYLALSWTTFIGKGRLLADGIYPQGTYLCMSLIDRIAPGDVYSSVRFLGPLFNVFELVVFYFVVSRVSRSRAAGLLALAVFGLFAGHPDLLVVWPRQIGAMTNEFAIAFGLLSIMYAAKYLTERTNMQLALAAGALFVAVTSNTLVLPLIVIGYLAVGVVGLVTGAIAPLLRLAALSAIAALAANYYMLLGFLQGNSFVMSFRLYQPGSNASFSDGPTFVRGSGDLLRYNDLYLMGFIGACIGVAIGFVAWRRHRLGHGLAVLSLAVAVLMLLNDLVGPNLGLLFRTRMDWMVGGLIPVGMGLGLGAIFAVIVGSPAAEPIVSLVDRNRTTPARSTLPRSVVAIAGLVVVALVVVILLPREDAIAREAAPSGYPAATDVSLDIIRNERALEFTMVGVSEQYQEVLSAGFFVEAWVFARDITMTDARDPEFEVPIPTNRVYIFVEKETFQGPESPPVGPTEEYYRDTTKRGRIMQRMLTWCEKYRDVHADMTIIHDDPELRVYEIDRKVDVGRMERSTLFKDYRWEPGKLFEDDSSITEDRIESNPSSGQVIEHA